MAVSFSPFRIAFNLSLLHTRPSIYGLNLLDTNSFNFRYVHLKYGNFVIIIHCSFLGMWKVKGNAS